MPEALFINSERIELQIKILKQALCEAILDTGRVSRRTVEVDPAGNVYEIDWLPKVKAWANLCDLNLEDYNPSYYDR